MSSISKIPQGYPVPGSGTANVYAVKPVQARGVATFVTQQRNAALLEERRRAKRRLSQQAMLAELRSGVERRRNSSEGGIDEEA
jgi:hypothetical protein